MVVSAQTCPGAIGRLKAQSRSAVEHTLTLKDEGNGILGGCACHPTETFKSLAMYKD